MLYMTGAYLVVMFVIPFSSLILVNSLIIRTLHKSNKERQRLEGIKSNNSQVREE